MKQKTISCPLCKEPIKHGRDRFLTGDKHEKGYICSHGCGIFFTIRKMAHAHKLR